MALQGDRQGYFFLDGAFLSFSGLAAGLSVYSSGWCVRQVLHISLASFDQLYINIITDGNKKGLFEILLSPSRIRHGIGSFSKGKLNDGGVYINERGSSVMLSLGPPAGKERADLNPVQI